MLRLRGGLASRGMRDEEPEAWEEMPFRDDVGIVVIVFLPLLFFCVFENRP